jgi:hypothetical protein
MSSKISVYMLYIAIPVLTFGIMLSAMAGGQGVRHLASALCGN